MIVDCHVHLSFLHHEGLDFFQIRDSLLASMRKHGIGLSLILADSEPDTGVSDLDETLRAVKGYSNLRALGSASPPSLDKGIIERLDNLASSGEIMGLKLYPGFELFYPSEERCRPLYEICLGHDMPVLFHSGETMNEKWREKYNHPNEFAKLALMFPKLKIIVAHFSLPSVTECRDIVVKYPNIHADISGLAYDEVVEELGADFIRNLLNEVASAQPEKVLYGTDWPICDPQKHLDLVESLKIPDSSKELLLSQNAERLFPIDRAVE